MPAVARPRPPYRQSPTEHYTELEKQVAGVAATLDSFIKDAKEYRERNEREQDSMWKAIREQGENLGKAVEKLSTKGQISWPMVVATVGMILTVSGGAATVGQMLVEARVKQLEIRDERLLDMGRENHAAIRELERESRAPR